MWLINAPQPVDNQVIVLIVVTLDQESCPRLFSGAPSFFKARKISLEV